MQFAFGIQPVVNIVPVLAPSIAIKLVCLPKFGRKCIGQTRLHEERGTTFTLGAFAQRWCTVACEQDDRDIPCSRLALQILNELPSVSAAQSQVRDDDVWVRFPRLAKSLFTVTRLDRLETCGGKTHDVQLRGIVLVVDDEHQRPGRNESRVTAVHGVRVWNFLRCRDYREETDSSVST
jgi:hypothetical protein